MAKRAAADAETMVSYEGQPVSSLDLAGQPDIDPASLRPLIVQAAGLFWLQGFGPAPGIEAGVPQRFARVDISEARDTGLLQQKVF